MKQLRNCSECKHCKKRKTLESFCSKEKPYFIIIDLNVIDSDCPLDDVPGICESEKKIEEFMRKKMAEGDVPANDALAGKLRKRIQKEISQSHIADDMNRMSLLEEFLKWLDWDSKESFPTPDAPANDGLASAEVEKICLMIMELPKMAGTETVFWNMMDKIKPINIAIKKLFIPDSPAQVTVKKIEWKKINGVTLEGFIGEESCGEIYACGGDITTYALDLDYPFEKFIPGLDSLELAQSAVQTALNNFVTGLIETEVQSESKAS